MVRVVTSAADSLARARLFLGTIPGAAERATARAINVGIKAALPVAVETIVARYAARPADVLQALRITTAKPANLEASLVARSGSLALGYFPHDPAAAGTGGPGRPQLTAEVKRGAAKAVGGAFVATIGGKPRIMIRTGGVTAAGKGALKTLFTVPLAQMLGVEAVRDAVEVKALAIIDARMTAEIDRELGRGIA